jgi:tetratricopeptide (TPR) repeat protein
MAGDLSEAVGKRNLEAARHFLRSRQYAHAVAAARECLAETPNSAEVHMVLMSALIDGKYWEEAKQEGRELLRVAPESARAHYLVGLMHGKRAEWGRAAPYVAECLRLNPGNEDAWSMKAQGEYARGEREAAKLSLRKALELAPGDVTHRVLLARYEMPVKPAKADVAVAVERIKQALAGEPENEYAWRTLARLYSDPLKEWREAEEAARVVLRKDPGDEEMQKLLLDALRHRRWEYRVLMFPGRLINGHWRKLVASRMFRVGLVVVVLAGGGGWALVWGLLLGPAALYLSCWWPLESWYRWMTMRDIRREAMGLKREAAGWRRWWTPRVQAAALFPVPALLVAGLIGFSGVGWLGGFLILLMAGLVILLVRWVRRDAKQMRVLKEADNELDPVVIRERRAMMWTLIGGGIVMLALGVMLAVSVAYPEYADDMKTTVLVTGMTLVVVVLTGYLILQRRRRNRYLGRRRRAKI